VRAGLATASGLAARIGIATDLVMVGELIGEGAAKEQTVVGETQNLARDCRRLRRRAPP
jgi:class 3 adenylate cyclase